MYGVAGTSDVEVMCDGGQDAGASTTHFARVVAAVFSCTVCTITLYQQQLLLLSIDVLCDCVHVS